MNDETKIKYARMNITNALFDNSAPYQQKVEKIADAIYDSSENRYFTDLFNEVDPDENDVPAKRFRQNLTQEQLKILEEGMGKACQRIESNNRVKKSLAATLSISVLGSLFFLSPNITGNAVGNLSIKSGSIIVAGLFLMGIIAGFLFFRKY